MSELAIKHLVFHQAKGKGNLVVIDSMGNKQSRTH